MFGYASNIKLAAKCNFVPVRSSNQRCLVSLHEMLCLLFVHLKKFATIHWLYFADGDRIAKSTPIDVLLRQDFYIVVNDQKYLARIPAGSGNAFFILCIILFHSEFNCWCCLTVFCLGLGFKSAHNTFFCNVIG